MKNDLLKKIEAVVDNNIDNINSCLSDLVRIPSVTGKEAEAQKYVEKMYKDIGLKVESFIPDIVKLKKHPAYVHLDPEDNRYFNRPNVEGILEGTGKAKSIKLNAHIDTVPPGPEDGWKYPPTSGNIIGDRLYGLGAVDNKHGIVANYFALKCLLESGIVPEGTIILESAVEEEDGGAGTLAGLIEGYTADGLIVTDTVSDDEGINIACAGINYCTVRVKGLAAHTGYAEFGENAILKMNKIVQAIHELDERRGREIIYPLFLRTGKKKSSNHVVTIYNAGTYRSSVPDWAEILCRLGNIPGEKSEHVREEFESVVMNIANSDEWLKENPPIIKWTRRANEAWSQKDDHPIVQTYKWAADNIYMKDIPLTGFSASCDIRFSQYFGMPGLVTGARGGNSHSPNEYVDLPSLYRLIKVLSVFLAKWQTI